MDGPNDLLVFWRGLAPRARAGLLAGLVVVLAGTGGAAWWLLRTDHEVLFADLAPQDAAAMAAELDKQKMPYRLADEGRTILVAGDRVHPTRLKLMGKDLPLRGAVGFELFNTSDFGMTEFAQKVNYQRALQGELTRTILSLGEVKDARVLLVLPEQGLFKQSSARAKASVTLAMRPGGILRAEQVAGIQRLVAASVPGMVAADVTLVDSNGVAISRGQAAEGDVGAGSGPLDLKKEIENYLARKAADVLDRTFGPGQAVASVDVVLNTERAQVTTEDVVAPPGRAGQAATGVVVRERESVREPGASAERASDGSVAARNGTSQREVEYAVGRRIEQVVNQPGSVRRVQAVAIVRQPLDTAQSEQIRRVLAATVGASFDRGDTVVVHSLGIAPSASRAPAGMPGGPLQPDLVDTVDDAGRASAAVMGATVPHRAPGSAENEIHASLGSSTGKKEDLPSDPPTSPTSSQAVQPAAATPIAYALVRSWIPLGALFLATVASVLALRRRRRDRQGPDNLTPAQREAALAKLRTWLAADTVGPGEDK